MTIPSLSVAHRQILVHAYSVELYRQKYQSSQGGRIGITLNIDWTVPIDDSKEAKDAADLAIAMALGWVSSPSNRHGGSVPLLIKSLNLFFSARPQFADPVCE